MKNGVKRLIILSIILAFLTPNLTYAKDNKNVDNFSKSSILIDQDTGRVLYEKDPDTKRPLASLSKMPPLKQLWVAPFTLHKKIVEALHQLAQTALAGLPAKAIIKMNSLTDLDLIKALVQAGQAGVQIDLIIRGACMLAPQVPGLTENIRVRSVIGRFLEHSRVFYFVNNGLECLYLSSADWMNRNMLRRVETAWPVNDPVLRKKIVDEALDLYLQDNTDAWLLDSKGAYTRCSPAVVGKSKAVKISAQTTLMKIYS